MPYIPQTNREMMKSGEPATPGELNFVLTQRVLTYVRHHGGPSYHTYNEVIGVLECMKQEIYRRLVAPHEDLKIDQNGDVF